MRSPNLHILVSEQGMEEVDAIYAQGQELDAWRLCQRYLPLLIGRGADLQTTNPVGADSAVRRGGNAKKEGEQ